MKKFLLAVMSLVLACGIGFAAVGCNSDGGDIVVVSRESGSGTRDGFEDVVGIESLCQDEGFTQHGSTGEVRDLIKGNTAGDTIGYISLGSVDTTVKAVQYNGVDANETNILNGTYGLQRPFVICYQSEAELSDLAKEFIDFIMSAEGQAILEEEGYISETH